MFWLKIRPLTLQFLHFIRTRQIFVSRAERILESIPVSILTMVAKVARIVVRVSRSAVEIRVLVFIAVAAPPVRYGEIPKKLHNFVISSIFSDLNGCNNGIIACEFILEKPLHDLELPVPSHIFQQVRITEVDDDAQICLGEPSQDSQVAILSSLTQRHLRDLRFGSPAEPLEHIHLSSLRSTVNRTIQESLRQPESQISENL